MDLRHLNYIKVTQHFEHNYWFLLFLSQSSQLISKNLILEFPKKMIKPP